MMVMDYDNGGDDYCVGGNDGTMKFSFLSNSFLIF